MRLWIIGGTSGIGSEVEVAATSSNRIQKVWSTGLSVDVRSQEELDKFAVEKRPDALVYSAGINHLDWSQHIDISQAALLYDVNVLGLIRSLRTPAEIKRCVVIGSDAAWKPMRTSVAYCASKAALHQAVRVIARERSNLCINVVAPGKVEGTEMTKYVDWRSAELRPGMDHISHQIDQIPGRRFCTPGEVAEVVMYALLSNTDYLSGTVIPMNRDRD